MNKLQSIHHEVRIFRKDFYNFCVDCNSILFLQDGKRCHFYKHRFPHNHSEVLLPIAHNIEQADNEFGFNFVIDSMWRMAATVMGICMPAYERSIPLITSDFYVHFTEDFLILLAKEWTNTGDNTVYQFIMGEWYDFTGPYWTKLAMEAAFVASGDTTWRPPRYLLVNGGTEANYFVEGPQSTTPCSRGRYADCATPEPEPIRKKRKS